jgi:flagellar M-ring protein FliF
MDFKELLTQLSKAFTKLNRNHKIIVVATFVAIIGFLTFLILSSMSKEKSYGYEPLFESVSYEEAGLIVEELKKSDIPYNLERTDDERAVVEVPKNNINEARIKISTLGLPKDHKVGFELFNKQDFGATDFDQKIKYLRAIEGELSRTIETLQPIKTANVHIALPKESLFVQKETLPTASVVISLRESMILTQKQIKGIKHLVASSVPKLSAESVTLVNAFGEPLGDDDELTAASEEAKLQMLYKRRYEKLYEDKIIDVLAPFIGGEDRVVAKVTIEFDFSKQESQKEYYDPETVVRSEQSLEELREGFKPKEIEGVPGAVSNIGPVQGLDGEQKEKYEKNKATTNYEISKTVSTNRAEFSRIKRITAAVVVDGQYRRKTDENGDETGDYEYVELDENQIGAIRALVARAIGLDNNRGDDVTVRNFQFQSIKDMLNKKVVLKTWRDKLAYYIAPFENIIKYIIAAIILFIFYRMVIRPFAEKMLESMEEEEEVGEIKINVDDDFGEDLSEKYSAMKKKVEGTLGLDGQFSEETLKYDILVEKVTEYIEENTDEVSNLLQLLVEEENSFGGAGNQQQG